MVAGGGPAGTLLHTAAWEGRADIVERLLALGAAPTRRSEPGTTPLGWAAHGSRYNDASQGDFVAVAELLVAAGNPLEEAELADAEGPLREWLDERL